MEDQYKSAEIKRVLFGEAKKSKNSLSGADFIHALTTVKESGKERSRGLFNEDGWLVKRKRFFSCPAKNPNTFQLRPLVSDVSRA